MKAYLFHVRDQVRGRHWWVVSDGVTVVRTRYGGTEEEAREKWLVLFGHPSAWVRVQGWCSPAEAAAQLTGMQIGGAA